MILSLLLKKVRSHIFLGRKFTKIVKIVVCLLVLTSLLYLASNNEDEMAASSDRPKLTSGLGNFETDEFEDREGPGENGRAHYLKPDQQNAADLSESEYGMNMACSDEISLDRAVPDLRLEECRHWNYPEDLPTTSVIIVFHNEGWSVLLRTITSVLNRSPPAILQEILLIDDFSDKENLKDDLENYIETFPGKVRLIRNKQREGLIRSKSKGAQEASGDVIIFLDAHCEVNKNWLPPLLAPIYRDRTVMTVPIIDGIDRKTFEYTSIYGNNRHLRGIFEWGMLYKENQVPQRELNTRQHYSEPYKSPTHAGGLFAIDRKYFLEIGTYDPGLLVWGGENFELSFKIWQCGGSIEWVPCSRVGHVYKSSMPYNFGKLAQRKKGPLITINYKRVIETWFDDRYKEFFYARQPLARFLDMGNITEQLALKEKLKCKSFEWYMENVAYDVLDKFPEPPPNLHFGKLRSVAVSKCLDTRGHDVPTPVTIQPCQGFGVNQLFRINAKGQLGVGERCVEGDTQGIRLTVCRQGTVNGSWFYDENTWTFLHRLHKKCMALHPQTLHLSLVLCRKKHAYHQWEFKEIGNADL